MQRSDDSVFQAQVSVSPLSVFCAAAPCDDTLLVQWETYLLPLQQAHLISCWSTRHVAPGRDVEQERSSRLDSADLILLLLSADFFASQECLTVMHHALKRQQVGSARVIPLLLRPVEWRETELGALTPLPTNGIPVVQWTTQDEAWHACMLDLHPVLRRRLSTSFSAFPSLRAQRRAASDRERMLNRLQKTYQELLNHSLQGITWMELGLASKPDAVHTASCLLMRLPEQSEQVLPAGTSILHVYEHAQEELLILGAPGAGKSTLLLNLALHLVDRATTDETHPLPVILPLSSWAVQRPPLAEWMIEYFARIYDVPHILSTRWVEHEHVLPLLDGLDEMEETAHSACIAAINTYHREHLTPLVVCSRQQEYDAAMTKERLALQSAIVVQPFTDEQTEAFLRTAGPAFVGLQTALSQQPALRKLASTPLMLSVLLLTYQGALQEPAIQPGVDLEQQVWTDYVVRMVERKGNETHYPLERTHRWLSWLAQQMRAHLQTTFYAEYLHADWLPSNQLRSVVWLSIRIPAFVLGVLSSLLISFFASSFVDQVSLLQIGLLGGFVGSCLSRNYDIGNPVVGSHPTISKRTQIVTSILLGTLIAAAFSFNLSPSYSLGGRVRGAIMIGIGIGLSAYVFQILLSFLPKQQVSVPSKHPFLRWHIFAWFNTVVTRRALLIGAILGGGVWLSYGLSMGLGNGLSQGLSLGLTVVLISIIFDASSGSLRFAERIHWTWQSLLQPKHLCTSLIVTSMVFLFFGMSIELNLAQNYWSSQGLSYALSIGLVMGLSQGLSQGLSVGISYWLLLGLYQGMKQEHLEDQDRHQFNQGIRRSLHNGMLISLVSASIIAGVGVLSNTLNFLLGFLFGITLGSGLSNALSMGLRNLRQGLIIGLSNGLGFVWILLISGFLLMWAMSGGVTILRHYVIRWLLARTHRFPWRPQAFLDDATARILLQRAGGGYRFIHRRLLDYFADLDTVATPPSTTTEATMLAPVSEHEV